MVRIHNGCCYASKRLDWKKLVNEVLSRIIEEKTRNICLVSDTYDAEIVITDEENPDLQTGQWCGYVDVSYYGYPAKSQAERQFRDFGIPSAPDLYTAILLIIMDYEAWQVKQKLQSAVPAA